VQVVLLQMSFSLVFAWVVLQQKNTIYSGQKYLQLLSLATCYSYNSYIYNDCIVSKWS
jgi:hypothetical protein